MDKKIIAENIRTLRKAFSETQLFLAEKVCHVDRTLINKWESGTRTPDPECIKTIAAHYGVEAYIFVSKYIRAEMDWNSGRITVTVEGQGEDKAENAFVNSIDMTPYLIEGFSEGKKTVQRVLIIPRIGIGREKVYEVYKRAYLLDEEIDMNLSDDRMTQVVEDYWYAYDNGIEDAGVNLLRIFFLYFFTQSSGKDVLKRRIENLITGLKLTNNPAADYYEALCQQWGVFDNCVQYERGAEIIEALAEDMNVYAMKAKDFLHIGGEVE